MLSLRPSRFSVRFVCFLLITGFAICFTQANELPSATVPSKHKALFKTHCFDCHDAETREGKVDLENLSFDLNSIQTAETWQKVLGAINAGEMPPQDSEQIPAQQKVEFLQDLSAAIVTARKLLSDSGGVITMRRLNRREYANTIRELLGVEVDVQDLPSDENSSGFDTAGASLFFSSDQFEQYLKIGRRAIDEAIVTSRKPNPKKIRREAELSANKTVASRYRALQKQQAKIDKYKNSDGPPTKYGFIDEARVDFEQGRVDLNLPLVQWYRKQPSSKSGALMVTSFNGAYIDSTTLPQIPGKYIVRVAAAPLPDAQSENCFLDYGFKGKDSRGGEIVVEGCRKVTGSIDKPSIIEIPVTVTKTGNRSFALRQRQPNNASAMKRTFREQKAANGIGPIPSLWIDWVEVEGPIVESWPPKSHKSIFFKSRDAEQNDKYARQIINRFATRAFRGKKPKWSFTSKLFDLYKVNRKSGQPFSEAIREPLAIVLASPSFLYLSEPNNGNEKRPLSDMELANRLSYFLWSAPPDQELLELAKNGKLNDQAQLAAQTDRMLDDPRAWELISGFTHQWLDMERLDFFQFNERLYPHFDASAKAAARLEVYHTINVLLSENLPISKLLKSDFVVINDLLASYYEIPGVEGPEFRRVDLAIDSPRGGLLGTAAILAMGSDGERTSPVERGAWIMRKLLHDPPPPAPANVPQLSRLEDKKLSSRELQKAHMEEPQCAQCHRKIDPLGFALEKFDATGKWREKEIVKVLGRRRIERIDKFRIDSSGTLPDGTEFSNYFEMRDRIAEREDDFARGLTEALIEYGLGRPYAFSDGELAEAILSKSKHSQYRLRTFVHALVQSKPFQTK